MALFEGGVEESHGKMEKEFAPDVFAHLQAKKNARSVAAATEKALGLPADQALVLSVLVALGSRLVGEDEMSALTCLNDIELEKAMEGLFEDGLIDRFPSAVEGGFVYEPSARGKKTVHAFRQPADA